MVSIGDNSYLDPAGWGDSLADFVDQGGVVVQTAYDSWEGGDAPQGRFASGGYTPFIPGDNVNENVSLADIDTSSPLSQGVATLTSAELNTAPELAPGASLIAKWGNGANAIAVKGRVVSVSAFIGDHYGLGKWSGDYARLILNAVIALERRQLTVFNGNPGGGTLTGPEGISCGSVCDALLIPGTAVSVSASPR